ncbi:MAG: hypothetical protein LQ341_003020 [Variospora aurantia]|nr:MAG: hypothetical protein LQ341_003020 [Variospora aurantia]
MATQFLRSHGINLQDEISKVQSSRDPVTPGSIPTSALSAVTEIRRVRIAGYGPELIWDVSIKSGGVVRALHDAEKARISTSDTHVVDGQNAILAPSLCHPHIHLDKSFLLYDPKYSDLSIEKGDLTEALSLTARAKARFTAEDLERRGCWLINESIAAGVTCMRAFVEVDASVRLKCLGTGLKLKHDYRDACEIQICAFAQDPLFSGEDAVEGRRLMEEALGRDGVDVVGTTPYVEASEDLMRKNVDWAIEMAMKYGEHLDLHLDYHLDANKEPMVYYVIDALHGRQWMRENRAKKIVLGHCTRLTLFTKDQWHNLRTRIGDLPVSFIGLPMSDLFMMGKPSDDRGGGERVRGTLQIPQMIQQYGFEGAIGINNVGNAFTPHGSCDPLAIASMGVGVYHAGTEHNAAILYETVSTRAKVAIGCRELNKSGTQDGGRGDFVLFRSGLVGGGRVRRTLQQVVYDPPKSRLVLYKGHAVSSSAEFQRTVMKSPAEREIEGPRLPSIESGS